MPRWLSSRGSCYLAFIEGRFREWSVKGLLESAHSKVGQVGGGQADGDRGRLPAGPFGKSEKKSEFNSGQQWPYKYLNLTRPTVF